jgi:hypothetical protein
MKVGLFINTQFPEGFKRERLKKKSVDCNVLRSNEDPRPGLKEVLMRVRQHRQLLLDIKPAPPFYARQQLDSRVRHRSCAIASSSSKPASRILTPLTARRPSAGLEMLTQAPAS